MGAPAPAPGPPQKAAPLPLAPQPLPDLEPPALTVTPKAVVKPQVVTHIIDGHVIKESSTPFPVSPSKAPVRRKSEKDEAKVSAAPPNTTAPVKRGPGRPPGSMNKSTESKLNSKNNSSNNTNTNTTGAVITNNGDQPPEKKMKTGPVKE